MTRYFFTPKEVQTLRARLKGFRPRHVFFCSFESRFAKSGGLAPVAMNTLPALRATGRYESVNLLSPFYPHLMDAAKLTGPRAEVAVKVGSRKVRVELLSHATSGTDGGAEYFLKADGFFTAKNPLRDPYLYVRNDSAKNDRVLRDNSLFFCTAAPAALAALGTIANVVLHLQEWQTAAISLTAKDAMIEGLLTSCATVQTIHNPYDAFLRKSDLKRMLTNRRRQARIDRLRGTGLTAFQLGLQLVDAPAATVSENFARELTADPLQTEYFAPHLQRLFALQPVAGINNGPFVKFSDKFPRRQQHSVGEVAAIKNRVRHELLRVLDSYHPPERFGELTYNGKSIVNLPDDVPIVLMSGRLDPNQKGYDILLQALERFAADGIKAVLTPLPVRAADLSFFRAVAARCRGNVTVFPIRMEQGYVELQTGATFGVMPSIYEPFGAAIEYMVSGTPTIARLTGGLVDQVVPGVNGFAFREEDAAYDLDRISDFMQASRRVAHRKKNPWATDMAAAMFETLTAATSLYRNHRDEYYRMILRGFEKAQAFSWDANAARYAALYESVATS